MDVLYTNRSRLHHTYPVKCATVANPVRTIACRVSHDLSSCYSPRAGKLFVSFLMTLLVGQHIRQSPDSEISAALQTVETVVRTHRLDADKVPMFSVGWAWQGFCRDLDPCCFK